MGRIKTTQVFLSAISTASLLLVACGNPTAQPPSVQPAASLSLTGEDAFTTQARLALVSYQEIEASLSDSKTLASQRFTSLPQPVLIPENADQNDFDVPVLGQPLSAEQSANQNGITTSPGSLPSFDASVAIFDDTVSRFTSQLLATQGVEFDGTGKILINPNQLRARIRSDLLGEGHLADPSLDLGGRLKANVHANLTLQELANLGYSATSSDVAAISANSESVLLTFRDLDADLINRIRVSSRTALPDNLNNPISQGYDLRLDTQSAGLTRTGLRSINYEKDGTQIRTEVQTTLDDGSQLELSEQRFVSHSGAGTGFGSFAITSGGASYGGSLRSLISADGRLTLMLQPDNQSFGRLMLQEGLGNRAILTLYRPDGVVSQTREIDLEATLDAMAMG